MSKLEIVGESIKLIFVSALLIVVCFDADYPAVIWKSLVLIFKGAIIGLAYFSGGHFADTKKGLRNYFGAFYAAAILSIIAWAQMGTHTEGADPLFGGGETVIDFVPTSVEQANHAVTIFLSLFVPAIFGMYKKRNPY